MTTYNTIKVDGLDIFYRDAGTLDSPSIVLLHGFPTSSHMYRNLIPALSDKFHLVAPDYPGFGNSSMPLMSEFDYTFDNIADIIDRFITSIGLKRYSLYMMDYGAPVGCRIASRHPERVQALIIQNGNAYEDGLREFWEPIKAYWNNPDEEHRNALRDLLTIEATRWQYLQGVRDPSSISPDNWNIDQYFLNRPGNDDIQYKLFYDYRTNVQQYPEWHRYFREHQPPALVIWGKNDIIFPVEGAHAYKRDLRDLEIHLIDTGHFALEEDLDLIAGYIRRFMSAHGVEA